jgi:hypothetical protein
MTGEELAGWDDYGRWSGILDLLSQAMRTYEDHYQDPAGSADRLRTLGRMIDHAAGLVREDQVASRLADYAAYAD